MLESGHFIAGYQIVKPLTKNQLYCSYLVTGSSLAAGKLLLIAAEQLTEKRARQAFLDQANVLLGQSFSGFCCLADAAADDDVCYCLYPFAPGISLAEELTADFPIRRSLEIVRELANCLRLPHAEGLCHGCISPANIYLDDGSVSLDEFALASLLPLDFNSGVDPCYSSPELVRGEQLTAAADLYSLGIVLYRLLSGALPFDLSDPFATAMQHVQEEAAPLHESLSLLQPLLDGLLCAAPADRWTAEQLVAEIDRYLLLPEIDSLQLLPQAEGLEELPVATGESSSIEKLMNSSDITARIEERLKDRADILRSSSELIPDAKRASTARMTAIGQQNNRKNGDMDQKKNQPTSASGRLPLLIALGIAIGVIFFLLLFGPQAAPPPSTATFPQAFITGLELGSQQLQQGDLIAAEQTFQELAEEYALYPQPYNNLAAIYAKQGDLQRSRTFLERAMATDASYVTVYRNLGTVYSALARDSYGRALQLGAVQPTVALQLFNGNELLLVNAPVSADPAPGPVAETPAEELVAVADTESVDEGTVSAAETTVVVEATSTDAAPVAAVASLPEPESAEEFLARWAAAWSAQDVDAYLSFYAAEFTPSAGISRSDWVQQRKTRLTRPKNIEVTLDDFSLVRQADEQLQIEVTQSYKSDRYVDRTRKLFDLSHDGSDWLIVRERSLGRAR